MALRLKDRIEANIRQSDKVNQILSIVLDENGTITYNGSQASTVTLTPSSINALDKRGDIMTGVLGLKPIKAGVFGTVLTFYRGLNRDPFKFYMSNVSTGEDSVYTCTPKANGIGVIGSFGIWPGEAYEGVNDVDSSDVFQGSSRSQFSFRQYSISSSTGEILNRFEDFDFPPTPNDLTTSTSHYIVVSNSNILGNYNTPVYVDDEGRLGKCSSFVPATGGTFTGSVYFDGSLVKYGRSGYYTCIDYYRKNIAGTTGITDGYTWASGNTGAYMGWSGCAIGGVETDGTNTNSYGTYWAARTYSMNSTTGARLNYYYTFMLPAIPNDLTSSSSYYIASSYSRSRGSSNQPVYLSGGYLYTCNSFVPTSGGSFTGQVTATSFNVEANARYYTAMYSTRKAQTVAEATYTSGTKTYTPVGNFERSTIGYFGMCAPFAYTYVDSSNNSTGTMSSGAYPLARIYSMNSSTGAQLSYYWTIRTVAVDNDLTASATMYVPVSTSTARGGTSQCMYMSGGKLYSGNSFVPTTGGTFTGDITIKKTTTIANNYPAQLVFSVVQSDNSLTNTASWIKVYDDHDTATNGCNMVIQAGGNMILGSGESANNCYTNLLKDSTTENMYITSDGNIYFYSNCGTWANHTTSVYINTSGVLYGACWNDYAEYRETKYKVKPGHVVSENGDDTLSQTYKRLQSACSIVSDTFGFAIGETEKCKTPLAMAGRVLAYPYEDRDSYKPGDAVCSGPNGTVSKMTCQEKVMYPECIIGYVSCVPTYETWGEKNTKVDGRIWIKVV